MNAGVRFIHHFDERRKNWRRSWFCYFEFEFCAKRKRITKIMNETRIDLKFPISVCRSVRWMENERNRTCVCVRHFSWKCFRIIRNSDSVGGHAPRMCLCGFVFIINVITLIAILKFSLNNVHFDERDFNDTKSSSISLMKLRYILDLMKLRTLSFSVFFDFFF